MRDLGRRDGSAWNQGASPDVKEGQSDGGLALTLISGSVVLVRYVVAGAYAETRAGAEQVMLVCQVEAAGVDG